MARYLIFCDINLTIGRKSQKYFNPEIIKIGAIKVCESNEVERFEMFVKPTKNPITNEFCIAQTDIKQSDIDNAKPFNEVWIEFEKWLGNTEDISFIFWGKENIKHISKEIYDKGYIGKLIIKKYFNFQSYLYSKTGKHLGIREAMTLFNVDKIGIHKDALWGAINLKNLYLEVVSSSDVNKLWFEGKMIQIVSHYNEIYDYFKQNDSENFSESTLATLKDVTRRCKVLLETSNVYTSDEREELLKSSLNEMRLIENDITEKIICKFRADTMSIQWSIIKNNLHEKFKDTREMLDCWENLSRKYKFFNSKRRGTYYMQFHRIKDLYRMIGSKMKIFCGKREINPIELEWLDKIS